VQKDLTHVWRNTSEEDIAQLMSLLQSFQIAFPKREEGLWVVPSMLRDTRQTTRLLDLSSGEYAERFARQYRLDLLPMGLFGRLIARLQG
jgi:hypothetical protein